MLQCASHILTHCRRYSCRHGLCEECHLKIKEEASQDDDWSNLWDNLIHILCPRCGAECEYPFPCHDADHLMRVSECMRIFEL